MLPSAGDLTLRPARAGDAERLVADLRRADLLEVGAACGPDVLAVVVEAIARTPRCIAADHGGALLFVGGVVPLGGGVGSPWMLGTNALRRHPVSLTRLARRYLQHAMQTTPHLVNFVDQRNTRSVRWLGGLGFTLFPAEPYGVEGLPFHRFEMHAED
jgi:hypothetical protein